MCTDAIHGQEPGHGGIGRDGTGHDGIGRDGIGHGGIGRRALLVTGAAGALTLTTMSFASAAEGSRSTQTLKGTLPPGAPDYVYLPVQVPRGVREIKVSYTYTKATVPAGAQNNALDIGLFDERGTALGGPGFRGWSGGARTEFFVRADDATPGYLPGPVRAGTWHVALGPYTVAPDGLPYEVTVELTHGAPGTAPARRYPPERAGGRGRAWYRGDCHVHSRHSDGGRTPAEIGALARAAGLDFINTSDHNTPSSHAHWADVAGDDLLVMLGEEVTTRNGHVLALGTAPETFIDWRYRARDNRWAKYAQEIRRAGGLVVPAHPHATCIGCGWKFGFGEADAVEVWNGPYTPDDEISLADWDNALVSYARSGRRAGWIPAMGNSDAHRDPDRIGGPQTVVLADSLSRDALQAGIKAGRSYVAESKDVEVSLSVTGGKGAHAGIGERLAVDPETPVTVELAVKGAPGCTLHLVTDQGTLFSSAPLPSSGAGAGTVSWRTTPSYAAYVRAEVRHAPAVAGLPGALAAFTNPVFLGV